jgi:hypothetical protein
LKTRTARLPVKGATDACIHLQKAPHGGAFFIARILLVMAARAEVTVNGRRRVKPATSSHGSDVHGSPHYRLRRSLAQSRG